MGTAAIGGLRLLITLSGLLIDCCQKGCRVRLVLTRHSLDYSWLVRLYPLFPSARLIDFSAQRLQWFAGKYRRSPTQFISS